MQNIEIKASHSNPDQLHEKLMLLGADFKGTDHQIDTYFNTKNGRLKLREGNIENSLISYSRPDQAEAKLSDFLLYHSKDPDLLKKILTTSLGVKVIVDKIRKIYYIDHVKFHIDDVEGLGSFMEIEVTNMDRSKNIPEMEKTCQYYIDLLEIKPEDLIEKSYSDLILGTD